MEVRVLVFETINSLNYWFKYTRDYLGKQNYQYFAVKNFERKITINNKELRFITYPIENKLIGLHHAKVYEDSETKLERNFNESLQKILKGE